MAKKKKKVVVTTKNKKASPVQDGNESKKKLVATKSKRTTRTAATVAPQRQLVFGKENYKWVGVGLALIAIGMFLMMGGFNENPAVWDESKIYGFRRTLLAPMVILSGLGVQIYAIFR